MMWSLYFFCKKPDFSFMNRYMASLKGFSPACTQKLSKVSLSCDSPRSLRLRKIEFMFCTRNLSHVLLDVWQVSSGMHMYTSEYIQSTRQQKGQLDRILKAIRLPLLLTFERDLPFDRNQQLKLVLVQNTLYGHIVYLPIQIQGKLTLPPTAVNSCYIKHYSRTAGPA